jgi:ribosomal protein S18 acetylase RimI-like enzyme
MTTFRRATVHDADVVAPLFDSYRQFYEQQADLALAHRFISERLTNNESVIFLALSASGQAVGFTQLYPMFSSARAARTYILNDLFVAPAARRSGVAAGLLNEAAAFARAAGAVRLSLSTAHTNEPAQRLYESLGWTLEQKFRWYGLTIGAQQAVPTDVAASRQRS